MIKWIESTGKTEEEAVISALRQLRLDRDSVSVEILERAKSGFLGIGSSPAKIKVSYEVPDPEPVPEPKPVSAPRPESKPAPQPKPAAERKSAPQPKPAAQPKPAPESAPAAAAAAAQEDSPVVQHIRTYLEGLLAHMGNDATPEISMKEDGSYQVNLVGSRLGQLIGRRGETLDAIQQLTTHSVNLSQEKRVRIHIDAENYRQKREASLCRLAEKVGMKVTKYRKNITLEPMNAYERHVIHTALQDWENIVTYSQGTEPNRRIVVAFSKGGPHTPFA
ncbi:MAG: protein jag [Oscillospiraceae bacterium]|nr:protein jag [Oscillospiraceae bacterium]